MCVCICVCVCVSVCRAYVASSRVPCRDHRRGWAQRDDRSAVRVRSEAHTSMCGAHATCMQLATRAQRARCVQRAQCGQRRPPRSPVRHGRYRGDAASQPRDNAHGTLRSRVAVTGMAVLCAMQGSSACRRWSAWRSSCSTGAHRRLPSRLRPRTLGCNVAHRATYPDAACVRPTVTAAHPVSVRYWFPLVHFISLTFKPTPLIGLNASLKMPVATAKPSRVSVQYYSSASTPTRYSLRCVKCKSCVDRNDLSIASTPNRRPHCTDEY